MINLTLVRHGETIENTLQILQGHLPGHLTFNGEKQAIQLGKQLAHYHHFDILLCSDLKRCHDTASLINLHLHIPLVTCPLLRERNWGELTGTAIATKKMLKTLPSSVESIEAMHQRACKFLEFLLQTHNGKNILAIGHGLFNRCIEATLLGCTIHNTPRMANAEIRTFSFDTDWKKRVLLYKERDLTAD